jgi:hypothetical protein
MPTAILSEPRILGVQGIGLFGPLENMCVSSPSIVTHVTYAIAITL